MTLTTKMRYKNSMGLLCFMLFVLISVKGQKMPIGFLDLDAHARSLQLLGKLDSNSSFFVRPSNFSAGFDKAMKTGSVMTESWMGIDTMMPRSSRFYFDGGKGLVIGLPAMMKIKFNSHHPYGWNDEAMKAAKGLQTYFSTGFFAQYGPLSVQVQPEWYWGAHTNFEHNNAFGAPTTGAYTKVLPGNSNALLNVGAMAAGISTQAIWIGPGQFSSLILSNNATNFPHLTFHSARPAKTFIGSFEWELIAGKLDEDSASGGLYENFHLKPATLTNDSRYYNAFNFSFQPKFFRNLFIGLSRAFQIYSADLQSTENSFFNKYLVTLNPSMKKGTTQSTGNSGDQQLSAFTRWVFPKTHAEFYFEYGQNDFKANLRDYATGIKAASAYIVGFKKIFPLRQKRFIDMSGEITQMAQSPDYLLRNSWNWYVHSQMRQGMTNDRQILGAGSGFGNNVQTLRVNWINGIQKLGIIMQRIAHDPVTSIGPTLLNLRPVLWTENSFGVYGRYGYKRWIASMDLQVAISKNYAWEAEKNRSNVYTMFNLAYIW